MKTMRIALLSPYSWTYPGGVTRHIEALAERFIDGGARGARAGARSTRRTALFATLHRGARPQRVQPPDYLISLGRTVGFKANGAVSNLSITPYGVATMHRELRTGRFDVVHVHEPIAPVTAMGGGRLDSPAARRDVSHLQRESALQRDRERARSPARVQPSARADRGVRGCCLDRAAVLRRSLSRDPQRRARRFGARACAPAQTPAGDVLRLVFVGQAVQRKGLPLLLRAFEALREHIPRS